MYSEGICIYGDGSFDLQRAEDDGMAIETAESEGGELVIMQYTGLRDKSGREIFESDKVRGAHFNGSYKDGIVSWSNALAGYVILPVDGEYFHADLHQQISALEVIGNVWENPELIPA